MVARLKLPRQRTHRINMTGQIGTNKTYFHFMLIVDASTNPPHLLGVDSNRSRQREISGFFVSAVVIDDPTKILPHRNFGRSTSGFSEKEIDETVHQMRLSAVLRG